MARVGDAHQAEIKEPLWQKMGGSSKPSLLYKPYNYTVPTCPLYMQYSGLSSSSSTKDFPNKHRYTVSLSSWEVRRKSSPLNSRRLPWRRHSSNPSLLWVGTFCPKLLTNEEFSSAPPPTDSSRGLWQRFPQPVSQFSQQQNNKCYGIQKIYLRNKKTPMWVPDWYSGTHNKYLNCNILSDKYDPNHVLRQF